MTTLPTLRASCVVLLADGRRVRANIATWVAAARKQFSAAERPAAENTGLTEEDLTAHVEECTARIEAVAAVLAVEDSADWYALSCAPCFRNEDQFLRAVLDGDEFLTFTGASLPWVRAFSGYRNFTV